MNIKQHIKKVLKENHANNMIKFIGKYLNLNYPKFNKDEVETFEDVDGRGFIVTNFYDMEIGVYLGKYHEGEKELQLSRMLFEELEGTFGDEMEYVIDWFNNEFGEDAEYVTY